MIFRFLSMPKFTARFKSMKTEFQPTRAESLNLQTLWILIRTFSQVVGLPDFTLILW
jgi:hypothetical protein